MPWPIIYYSEKLPYEQWHIGAMWPVPHWINAPGVLSNKYHREVKGNRPPLQVLLPGHDCVGRTMEEPFVIDRVCGHFDHPSNPEGWAIEIKGELIHGQTVDITLSPSINTAGYHGYIQHGFVTDDCENRRFS